MSIGDVIDDITWLYDVIIMMPQLSKSSHLSSHSETRI